MQHSTPPNEAARQLEQNMGLVVRVCTQMRSVPLSLDDKISAAAEAWMLKSKYFTEGKGKFSVFMARAIRQGIREEFRKSFAVPLPAYWKLKSSVQPTPISLVSYDSMAVNLPAVEYEFVDIVSRRVSSQRLISLLYYAVSKKQLPRRMVEMVLMHYGLGKYREYTDKEIASKFSTTVTCVQQSIRTVRSKMRNIKDFKLLYEERCL